MISVNNSSQISGVVRNLSGYFCSPMEEACTLRDKTNSKDGTWGQAIGARGLFIAQAIASIVALPILLLAAIFTPALALCIEGKENAWELLKAIARTEILHLSLIPTALIAAFAPHSAKCLSPTKEVIECLS
jgi:hypothetical protein